MKVHICRALVQQKPPLQNCAFLKKVCFEFVVMFSLSLRGCTLFSQRHRLYVNFRFELGFWQLWYPCGLECRLRNHCADCGRILLVAMVFLFSYRSPTWRVVQNRILIIDLNHTDINHRSEPHRWTLIIDLNHRH